MSRLEEAQKKSERKGRLHLKAQKEVQKKSKQTTKNQEKTMSGASEKAGVQLNLEHEDEKTNSSHKQTHHEESTSSKNSPHNPKGEKVHVQFFGSDLLRMKFPYGMDLMDQVATDWVRDQNFENLAIEKPVVKLLVKQGLRKAKDFEKTLEATGVLPMVRTQTHKVFHLIQKYRG